MSLDHGLDPVELPWMLRKGLCTREGLRGCVGEGDVRVLQSSRSSSTGLWMWSLAQDALRLVWRERNNLLLLDCLKWLAGLCRVPSLVLSVVRGWLWTTQLMHCLDVAQFLLLLLLLWSSLVLFSYFTMHTSYFTVPTYIAYCNQPLNFICTLFSPPQTLVFYFLFRGFLRLSLLGPFLFAYILSFVCLPLLHLFFVLLFTCQVLCTQNTTTTFCEWWEL